jgi:hypothetical protein
MLARAGSLFFSGLINFFSFLIEKVDHFNLRHLRQAYSPHQAWPWGAATIEETVATPATSSGKHS